jgi:L-galactose dehydrogenase
MRYRQLGASGLMLSTVGFGASALGGVFGTVDQDAATRAVRTALDLGVTFFDTAPFYGDTLSELALGRALSGVARDRYVLATKVGRYGAEVFDFSAARIAASVDESLIRLGVGHLDLVQCHDIEFAPPERIVEEALPALERLRAQGKVRAIGITGLPLAAFRAVLAHARVDSVLSYCHYTLADTTLADELPWLRAQGVGVINASPLAMGLLSDAGGPAWHPAPAAIRDACVGAAAHCRARGTELAKLALQFACALDGVASTWSASAPPTSSSATCAGWTSPSTRRCSPRCRRSWRRSRIGRGRAGWEAGVRCRTARSDARRRRAEGRRTSDIGRRRSRDPSAGSSG